MKLSSLYVVFALVLLASCASTAQAYWAFDVYTGVVDNGAGTSWILTDTGEYPGSYTGNIQSLNPTGSGLTGIIGQPKVNLARSDGSSNWTGFAMCIDTAHVIYVNNPQPDYHVYDWAGAKTASKLGTINPLPTTGHSVDYIWDRLTYMWSTTNIASDSDRAALQTATWFGCADQWDGVSGVNLSLTGMDSALLAAAQIDLTNAAEYNSTYAGNYVVFQDGAQAFAGAVPEPSSLVACSALFFSAALFVLRKK